jgi:hypothetical protein
MPERRRKAVKIRDIVMKLREKSHTIWRINGAEAIQLKGHERSWLGGKPVGGS